MVGRLRCLVAVMVMLCSARWGMGQGAAGLDPAMGVETLRLWPGEAPGAKGSEAADVPTLTVMRPAHANGTAMIVAPGGAYVGLSTVLEGREPGDFLASLGVTVFVLKYRLGPRYIYPAPLEDARRAVRLVRSMAGRYGYSPDRIGMMGFSAGGHLAAMAGVSPMEGVADDADPVQRQSSDLDFLVLAYPWLNAMEPRVKRWTGPMINYCSVTKGLTEADCQRLQDPYTPAEHVTAKTPPTFVFATTDDAVVPVETSVRFYSAMVGAGRDCELHLFARGPHGSGLGGTDPALREWPRLLELWMRGHGLLTPTASH